MDFVLKPHGRQHLYFQNNRNFPPNAVAQELGRKVQYLRTPTLICTCLSIFARLWPNMHSSFTRLMDISGIQDLQYKFWLIFVEYTILLFGMEVWLEFLSASIYYSYSLWAMNSPMKVHCWYWHKFKHVYSFSYLQGGGDAMWADLWLLQTIYFSLKTVTQSNKF